MNIHLVLAFLYSLDRIDKHKEKPKTGTENSLYLIVQRI